MKRVAPSVNSVFVASKAALTKQVSDLSAELKVAHDLILNTVNRSIRGTNLRLSVVTQGLAGFSLSSIRVTSLGLRIFT